MQIPILIAKLVVEVENWTYPIPSFSPCYPKPQIQWFARFQCLHTYWGTSQTDQQSLKKVLAWSKMTSNTLLSVSIPASNLGQVWLYTTWTWITNGKDLLSSLSTKTSIWAFNNAKFYIHCKVCSRTWYWTNTLPSFSPIDPKSQIQWLAWF